MRLHELILTKTFVKPGVGGLKLLRRFSLEFRGRAGEGSGGALPYNSPVPHTHIFVRSEKKAILNKGKGIIVAETMQ